MRISTRLAAVVLAVFIIVATVAGLAVDRMRHVARVSVEAEARNLATTFANMVGYQGADAGIAGRIAQFQRIADFIGVRQKHDIGIIGPDLVDMADVDREDIGKPLAPGARRDSIALTLKDGKARMLIEPSTGQHAELRQVVVPVYDGGRHIIAGLVYEYTPLYNALLSRAESSLRGVRKSVV